MNGLTGQKMQKIFKALVPESVYNDPRYLVEYCCFRFLSRNSVEFHPSLKVSPVACTSSVLDSRPNTTSLLDFLLDWRLTVMRLATTVLKNVVVHTKLYAKDVIMQTLLLCLWHLLMSDIFASDTRNLHFRD